MQCAFHIGTEVSIICIDPHNCERQRKLCVDCIYEHGVDIKKNTVTAKKFQELIRQRFKESEDNELSNLSTQRMNFKSLLSSSQILLKQICDEIEVSYKQIDDMMTGLEDISFLNIANKNVNPLELSNTELEKLFQIFLGKTLYKQNDSKKLYLKNLHEKNKCCYKEISSFCEKFNIEMKRILSLIQMTNNYQGKIQSITEIVNRNADLYQVLTYTKNIDRSFLNKIIILIKNNKITNFLEFISEQNIDKSYETDFYKKNYSTEVYEQIRNDLIKQISQDDKEIIEFLKFLIQLTAIDEKYIQCGSNSLNLLVEMKADLKEQCFKNIRIRDTSLIGGNFARCNFDGSNFDNVNVNGMNLNGAQLINCKWKNIKIHELNKLNGHSNSVRSICFSPDCMTLSSGSDDNSIRLWNVKSGQQKVKLDGHTCGVNSVCFSPNGTKLASGSIDKSIRLWDVKRGLQTAKLDGHSNSVQSVCFSSDGATLASGSIDKSIRLWDLKTGLQAARLDGHTNGVNSVCFSPNGTNLASGSGESNGNDNSVRLWDIRKKVQIAKFDGHSSKVNSVCFSHDGSKIASGSYDSSICLWDVETRSLKAKLDGHSNGVNSVCFSPNSTQLASGSSDKSIRLWDVKTGQQLAKFNSHNRQYISIKWLRQIYRLMECRSNRIQKQI
ncbi:unnamed protein product (macronuclear) [Paramecium tetraurelia]|uniref:Uncharacterized protein n=1 Tax=Paramecium tetraurelia TaxID=5888 RepID=A0E919_PARTE|nr:uncharacterized protein GSPATT00024517001 [Paramecium tetraurelia]CAK91786.1 unnamed protein product [Paramecium tetraurelia]|eukprot:XP_001459183.1 hypothetical protein (macronuclear) [Paramecium tetraurelia strain d4-2]